MSNLLPVSHQTNMSHCVSAKEGLAEQGQLAGRAMMLAKFRRAALHLYGWAVDLQMRRQQRAWRSSSGWLGKKRTAFTNFREMTLPSVTLTQVDD